EATEEAKKKTEKLTEAYEKASVPLNTLVKDYRLLEAAGKDANLIIKMHADEIVKAGEAQKKLGTPLNETAKMYDTLAKAVVAGNKTLEDNKKMFEEIVTSPQAAARSVMSFNMELEKMGFSIKSTAAETDDFKAILKSW